MKVQQSIVAKGRAFGDGVLVELIAALQSMRDGELVAVEGGCEESLREAIVTWSKLTGHGIVETTDSASTTRWVIRKGSGETNEEPARAIGSRIWLYTNFDCNLRCDYCCVKSSPTSPRRALELDVVRRVTEEAASLEGLEAFFLTGGEPFLLANIGEIVGLCAAVRPTTILTNAMLFTGSRLERLRAMPRRDVTLQVSLDSPTSELHDLHRGRGSWEKARRGIAIARDLGFRVRLAATLSSAEDEARFVELLDREAVAPEDRVIRRVVLRGFAEEGVAVGASDIVPEVTLTAMGVYFHPVGAGDDDLLVTPDLFPLASAIEAVRARWQQERRVHDTLAQIFHCA